MNHSDAADQIVNMTLKGIEVVAKISGAGAKNLATYLYAVLKDQKKTKGKARLQGLLRSGKELKVFAVKNEDLRKFTQEAKRYGVLYCALRDKRDLDGMCDIMVRAEDASKINRIVERFKLATVDTASIKSEIEKARDAKQKKAKAPTTKGTPAEKSTEDFLDTLMTKPHHPKTSKNDNANPTMATTERSRPSEPTYERKGKPVGDTIEPNRRSVREELREIRETQKEQADTKGRPVKRKSPRQPARSTRPNTRPKPRKLKGR